MPPLPEEPLSFDRLARARAAGCVAYVLLIPAFCVAALVGGVLLAHGIAHLAGGGKDPLILILGGSGFFGAAFFGIREYRRRSGNRILIYSDRLEFLHGKPQVYRFEDLLWIAGPSLAFLSRPPNTPLSPSYALDLKRNDGRRLHLRNEEWPLGDISQVLLDRAVPAMARAISDRLDRGETAEFRPGNLLAVRYLVFGAILTGLGGLLLFLGLKTIAIEKSFKPLGLPLLLTVSGLGSLVMVGRAKGGLLMERGGIRARRKDQVIPWERIREVRVLPDAVNIEADDGSVISVGMLARNYDACLELLRRRRPAS